jgi:hypothetical protein
MLNRHPTFIVDFPPVPVMCTRSSTKNIMINFMVIIDNNQEQWNGFQSHFAWQMDFFSACGDIADQSVLTKYLVQLHLLIVS